MSRPPSRARWRLWPTLTLSLVLGAQLGVQLGVSPSEAASPTGTVTFAAAADFGSSPDTAAVLTGIAGSGADLALALGDLSYGTTGDEQAWCDFVHTRVGQGYGFELVAGNHDTGVNGNINDFSACLPNQLPGVVGTYGRQYYVDYPRSSPVVRFIMISPNMSFNGASAWNYSAGSARYAWTAGAIDGARAASIPWVVVGMHYPCLSLGIYGCVAGADITDLMLAKRVDLVLTGHEHMYQRTKQLATGATCPQLTPGSFQPACVVDADAELVKGAGTVFVTSGLGGKEKRTVNNADPEAGYFAGASGSNQSPAFGYLKVVATASRLDGRFVATSGTFADSFTVAAPGSADPPVAADAFDRTLASGWGTADTGGAWTVTGAVTNFSVGGGIGSLRLAAGSGPVATLNQVSAADVDVTMQLGYDKAATGLGIYSAVIARRTSTGDYRANVRLTATATTISLSRTVSGVGTALTLEVTSMPVYAPGEVVNLRLQVQGSAPTTLRARAWKVGTAEPTGWQVTSTDSTTGLQSAGAVGIFSYLAGTATNGPITARVADFEAVPLR